VAEGRNLVSLEMIHSHSPTVLGGPAATGYRIRASYVLPRIPMLRGGPDFDTFLKARGQVALTRLMRKAGLSGVVNLGAVTLSGPSEVDGVTSQTVAVRVQVGAPHIDQWGGNQDMLEAMCLEAAHAALKVDGPYGYVGNLSVADGGNVPTTIKLPSTVRTLAADPKVVAEATAIFSLRYRHEDAPEDVATGNADDVVTGANGEEKYRWEVNG
jgi:hypothetical protein